jgi:hypothetical protein
MLIERSAWKSFAPHYTTLLWTTGLVLLILILWTTAASA